MPYLMAILAGILAFLAAYGAETLYKRLRTLYVHSEYSLYNQDYRVIKQIRFWWFTFMVNVLHYLAKRSIHLTGWIASKKNRCKEKRLAPGTVKFHPTPQDIMNYPCK